MKIEQEIIDFKKKTDFGKVGNDVLYEMCDKYPTHTDESQIVAKTWIIGRSYAASLERNRSKIKKDDGEDFFSKKVAPVFKSNFDRELLIKKEYELNKENIPAILTTHDKVVNFIHKEITGDDKRSFVSKYLHFHFRKLFFIYDSLTASVINDIIKEIGMSPQKLSRSFTTSAKYDYEETYAKFFIKCFHFWEFCKQKKKTRLDLRQIDSFLLYRANIKRAKKRRK